MTSQLGYDAPGWIAGVTNASYSAGYTYLANSPLIGQVMFKDGSTTRMTTTKNYDLLNRLLSISSLAGITPVSSHASQYNDANQRTRVTQTDGSFWVYEYDKLGQVISGKRYWADGTPVAGQQHEYTFDDIGNRTAAKMGGDATGQNLRSATYGANSLNQYTNRTVPSYLNIMGIAHPSATVTVNDLATTRKGEFYRAEPTVNNGAGLQYPSVTNKAVLSGTTNTSTGSLYVPKTPETFAYDADGNMTNDGRWVGCTDPGSEGRSRWRHRRICGVAHLVRGRCGHPPAIAPCNCTRGVHRYRSPSPGSAQHVWAGENRLLEMQSHVNALSGSKRKVVYTYDHQSRLISRKAYNGSTGSYVLFQDTKWIYDGWRQLAEVSATNSTLIKAFTWGVDLSGSPEAAGGIGGLLMFADAATSTTHFYSYDGNGNVMALAKASDGTKTADYEYGPFGEVLRASGSASRSNPFRFSTKCQDDETDLINYGYRFYNASTGRWPSRDPIQEEGGKNVYGFVNGDSISGYDAFGLFTHKSFCTWLQGKIRSFVSSAEDLRGWDRFVSGTASDIDLSDSEMSSVLNATTEFKKEINKLRLDCKTNPFGWHNRASSAGGSAAPPWSLSIGGVSIDITTTCACRGLTWEACIFDEYDFDPGWWNTHRSLPNEARTILVWAAQNASDCGWNEFHHKGCKTGFSPN